MINELFDDTSLGVILAPAQWQIISSLFEEDVDFCHNPTHLQWMRTHTERHPAREVMLVLKGSGVYGYNGKAYPSRPGMVFLFNSYESHDNYYPPNCPEMLHLWMYLIEHDVVARVLHAKEGKIKDVGSPFVLSEAPTAGLLNATWNELAEPSTLPLAFRRAKLLAALSALTMRITEWGFGKTEGHSESHFQKQVIETIRRHVAQTAGRDVPLSEAARLSGYSKFHFLRLFKKETGQTFHDFVNGCRLQKVSAMLHEGRSKTEISEALGFSHPSTFLRWTKIEAKKQHSASS